ncbi:Alpha/Beta hydrolase protein [Talaromyces proteolyticus]|uniref:Alpha/Beta hydrolase protein n=1 Tax=Talaromyces proteolyticus TaxID=1131652 RepID=A0AAD4L1Q5_9EURO|nr:Alpha/Beta hydrolase protein [Talaromyces proteolyticus]KAH8705539.1 Alpha/Beta hydrolase protein [Talaromyces proteolyticus]
MAWQIKHLSQGIRAITGGSSGTLVILIPGWPQTAEAYSSIFPHLAKSHRFVALDPPGLGDSAAPAANKYDTASVSTILAEALHSSDLVSHTESDIEGYRYHLVGHDIGGWIVYPWAAQYAARVRSLTILDAAVPGLLPPAPYPLPYDANVKLWQFSFNALPELPEALTQGRARELLSWLFKYKTAHPEKFPRENLEHYIRSYARPGAMSRGFEYYRAVSTSAKQNVEFAKTPLPILVLAVGGAGGVGERITQMVQGIAENVQGGAIEDCGHFVMEEQPGIVAERVLGFFAQT